MRVSRRHGRLRIRRLNCSGLRCLTRKPKRGQCIRNGLILLRGSLVGARGCTFDDAVREWIETECMSDPPTLDAFKDAFLSDPARREREREYQRRASERRRRGTNGRRGTETSPNRGEGKARGPRLTKRTEKERAYDREYQRRKRRENDPAYKEKQKQRQKAWRAKNPEYDKNRYANDPEYAESRKAARGKSMRKILSIGNVRRNGVGNLHGIIRSIRRSEGCICGSIGNGRRRGKRSKSESGFAGFRDFQDSCWVSLTLNPTYEERYFSIFRYVVIYWICL